MNANVVAAVYALPREEYMLQRGRPWHWAVLLLAAWLLLLAGAAAPVMAKPFRIGALTASWGPTPSIVGLRDGLVAAGYRENRDFVIGTRFTSGDITALPAAARELAEFGVDIFFSVGVSGAKAVQRASGGVPLVFTLVDNPVRAGLVRSYARPGGNITGVSGANTVLAPKRLEMFKKVIPQLRKALFVFDGSDPDSLERAAAYRGAASRLGIELVERPVRTEAQARVALAEAGRRGVHGILSPLQPALNIPGLVVESTVKRGIPSMFSIAFLVELGGLASYGPNFHSSGRQAARLVAKIMRGVKPADIPVEVNNDIEFTINLKVAKALGLKINREVLYQATKIIR